MIIQKSLSKSQSLLSSSIPKFFKKTSYFQNFFITLYKYLYTKKSIEQGIFTSDQKSQSLRTNIQAMTAVFMMIVLFLSKT